MSLQPLDFADFVSRIGVMKPNHAKKDDLKQLARLDSLLDSPEYALEKKEDGHRYKIFGHRLFSADNNEKTDNFPHIRDFFQKLKMANLILDGELNVPGKTSQYITHGTGPSSPSTAIHFQQQNGFFHYTMYDILRSPKGNWVIRNTYVERRKMLRYFYETFVVGTPMQEFIHLCPMTIEGKREYLQSLLDNGFEGGVLKRLDSQYHMGKKPMWQWMKFKQEDDTDLVIMGFEPPKQAYTGDSLADWPYWMEVHGEQMPVTKSYYHGWIGSVVLGAYIDGKLTKICTASGMSEPVRKDMSENSEQYLNKVARVTFMEKTSDGYPRHPVFKNLHETKQPQECIWEF